MLRSAERMFAVRGYSRSSLRDIGHDVGISHPGLLHHFPSKEALLSAVLDGLEDHTQGVIDRISSIGVTRASMIEAIRTDLDDNEDLLLLLAVLTTEAVDPDFPLRLRIMRLRRVNERIVERLLHARRQDGELAEDADIPVLARTLFSMAMSCVIRDATIGTVDPTLGRAGTDIVAMVQMVCSGAQATATEPAAEASDAGGAPRAA